MANPHVPQGVLNKLRGSVLLANFPSLNITASYLGEDGISLAFEGDVSAYLGTMTGAVPSPNPYQMSSLTIPLLKTQALANAWKAQIELNSTIGDISVITDATTLDNYYLSNCTLLTVQELNFGGRTPNYIIQIRGTYFVNSNLFNSQ